jgi:predicted metal-dependent phosphotriesterase family hydrolase
MHEHVFILDPQAHQNRAHTWGADYWDEDVCVAEAQAKLRRLRSGGIETIVDATAYGLGRNIRRIVRVNEGVDLNIVVATGIYAFLDALDALTKAGVEPTKIVIAHAGDSNDIDYLRAIADTGAWLGCDRFNIAHVNPDAARVRTLAALVAEGYAGRVHLGPDGATFHDFMLGNPFSSLTSTPTICTSRRRSCRPSSRRA